MKTKHFLSLILGVLLCINVWAQHPAFQTDKPASENFSEVRLGRIDQMLQQSIAEGYTCGAVGFIARDGKIIYNKAFGWDDPTKKVPLKTDNIFRIASQTKAITSVAVMILFEEGKFLLDDPISKYIPAFAHPKVLDKFNEKDSSYTTIPANREITIRDLLTHTSGIDYAQIGSDKMKAIYAKAKIPAGFVSDKLILGNEIKKLAALPLVHQPGESFTYGLNIDVLGYLVEIVSGSSLDQFFKERIFQPLGMNDTYFYLPASKFSRLVSVNTEDENLHLKKWDENTFKGMTADYPKSNGTYFAGGAGLVSTIQDYATFLQMLLNGGEYNSQRILSKRTVELMTSNQIGDLSLGADKFGLGFEITTKSGQAKLGITEGSFAWGGFFATTYWADPKEKLVCLLFMQQWPLTHGEIQDKFKAMVYQALND
jgi:CubicO group peptidase (beta-lactamase class C family)